MEQEVEEVKKKRKGRQKGAIVKKEPETVIEDSLIAPFKIYIDARCFTVAEDNPKGGFEKTYGHFSLFQSALQQLAKMKTISNKNKQTIEEFVSEYNKNLKTFSEKFKV
jgi:hypothetical protein